MPVINNATVATGTGLSTSSNGGRKLVRLANGTFVSGVRATDVVNVYKSTDNGLNWSLGFARNSTGVIDFAIQTNGERIFILTCNTGSVTFRSYDNQGNYSTNVNLDVQTSVGNVSLAINEAGTELHAAWSSKNATYPNSFNIRYAKGVINGDGSVTWGAVEQVTKMSNGIYEARNPSTVLEKNGIPTIYYEAFGHRYNTGGFNTTSTGSTHNSIAAIKRDDSLPSKDTVFINSPTWSAQNVHTGTSHQQASPSSLFIPQSINGLANGRLWVAWHGKDATDSAKFNIRVSFSDDGGVTWSTPVKLTSGNTFDRLNVSLSADKTGKVFALYEDHQWAPDLGIRMKTHNGSWGAEVGVATADTAEQHPSALVDFSLQMTTPPFVYTDTTLGIRFTGNFNVGPSVSPVSGALGNKESQSLTAYTVTPEAGSTVTSIVEKVNGVTVNTFNNPASLSRTLTVPTATWDTLAYFATHTASITVTDSNGATTVTTYSFDKRLATNASLLEAEKANTDAKNRISTKQDALAEQVGLSAGSTFDAISAQLASGAAFKKFATGTVNRDASQTSFVNGGGSTLSGYFSATVSGLGFTPSLIYMYNADGRETITCNTNNPSLAKIDYSFGRENSSSSNIAWRLTGNAYVTNGGFRLPVGNSTVYTYIALG